MTNSTFFTELKKATIFALCVVVFCEWLIYYVVIYQCSWPEAYQRHGSQYEPLKVLVLSDTHLLGPEDGHWFDKLRREWQMERAYQTAVSHFVPDVVFLLGDLFDEGMKCSDEEFESYVQRFYKMFRHAEDTKLYVVVGNHDIGFHPRASGNIHLFERFSSEFNLPSVQLLNIKGNLFVIVNSIALQGDSCSMCSEAMIQLQNVGNKLKCNQQRSTKDVYPDLARKPRTICDLPDDAPAPILIQPPMNAFLGLVTQSSPMNALRRLAWEHFPLYRPSESVCSGVDAPPPEYNGSPNREQWEVVSKEMSHKLLSLIKPRLVLSGHTHHGCYVEHEDGTPEITVPSFSWRNRNNPSFILGVMTTDDFALSKCFIPREATVIMVYIVAGVSFVLMNARLAYLHLRTRRKYR